MKKALNPSLSDPVDRWIGARPLALFAGCFLAGIVISRAAGPMPVYWASAAAAAAILMIVFKRRVFAFSLAMLLGACWMSVFLVRPPLAAEDEALITGVVDAQPVMTDRYVRLRLANAASNGEAIPCRVMVYVYDAETEFSFGDRVTLTANTYLPSHSGNPGGFDYADWLWRQNVALCASSSEKRLVDRTRGGSFSLMGWALRARSAVNAAIDRAFDEDCAGIAKALITGDRSGMDEETKDAFRATGVMHLLALSGLHVSALLMALNALLRRLRLSRGAALIVSLPFMAAYALIVGLTPSVIRACLMYTAAQLARLDGRPRDGLSAMSLSMLVQLIVNPLYVDDAGFVLSYCAVAGIILLPRPEALARNAGKSLIRRALNAVGSTAWVSLAAQLGALPATICYYNQLPLWFLPFNVALAPLMAALLPVLMAAQALSALLPSLSGYITALPEAAIRAFQAVTAWGRNMPMALVNAADWPAWLIALYAVSVFAISPFTRAARKGLARGAALAMLPLVVAAGLLYPRLTQCADCLEIVFVDVGQGDGAVINDCGRVFLVDTGAGSTMAEYLLNRGLKPEGIFLSHAHSDHAAGLDAIMDSFEPCVIYVSSAWDLSPKDEAVEEVWRRVLDEGWPVEYLEKGDELHPDGQTTLKVYHPGDGVPADQNAASMVLGVFYGESSALFTGDLPSGQEFVFMPDVDILKAAHHGAKGATGEIMLAQTTPSLAVISVGHNSYGHPSDDVLNRLSGIPVYRTDRRGAVTARLKQDGTITVSAYYGEGMR